MYSCLEWKTIALITVMNFHRWSSWNAIPYFLSVLFLFPVNIQEYFISKEKHSNWRKILCELKLQAKIQRCGAKGISHFKQEILPSMRNNVRYSCPDWKAIVLISVMNFRRWDPVIQSPKYVPKCLYRKKRKNAHTK